MNSSSTYLSSHQAAENPSATCRLTGDDSIAHKESALYRKVRNLSSIHDGMPNLCRIPDGCGLVYIKMLRLSSFFCQKFEPSKKPSENISFFYFYFIEPLCRPSGRGHLHQRGGNSSPLRFVRTKRHGRKIPLLPFSTHVRERRFGGRGHGLMREQLPFPKRSWAVQQRA